jgi:diguanylate cyclase (GGDEF)-like protein/putative nucleotidyltransferase with HDIG domain
MTGSNAWVPRSAHQLMISLTGPMKLLMADQAPARIVDVSEVHLRLAMVKAAVWLTFTACGAGSAYVAVTWESSHRSLLLGLFAAVAIAGLLIVALPIQKVVRSRLNEVFFVIWGLVQIGLIGAIVATDGGASSPLSVLFFLPLVFAALFYPLRSFVPVGAADVLTFVAVGSMNGNANTTYLGFTAAALASTAVMCAWQAQNHDRQRERLTEVSRTDPLTGCLNRRGFGERVKAELDEALRKGRPLALVLLDLDNFKAINDVEGHAAGDELLCWVVARVREIIRPADAFGRLGGDEFAVLAPGASQNAGLEIAKRAKDGLSERIGVTTGVSCFPLDGVERDELYNHADTRLYDAKHGHSLPVAAGPRELSWAAALARAVDARMAVPVEHSSRVAEYAAGIAEELGWSGTDLEHLRIAAMLHDVGKVPVPDRILRKPGPLNEEEYEEVKRHPATGAEMISRVDGVAVIAPWIRHSHENFDGSGYPDGLGGEAIPLASRILLVADAFDAMTSDRPYRAALSLEAALDQLRRNAGRQFDQRCVEAFEAYLATKTEPVSSQRIS